MKTSEILISVIIPVYNKEKYLNQCLDSIICQSIKKFEIICINDGSTDGSLEILKERSQKESRIKVVDQKNQGASIARNNGIRKAKGKFICFMDADDFYPSNDVLSVLVSKALEHKVLICGGELTLHDSYGIDRSEPEFCFDKPGVISFSEYQKNYGFTRFIYNRKFIIDNNIEFPQLTCYEDPVFLTKAMIKAKSFYALKRVVYKYRINHKTRVFSINDIIDFINGSSAILSLSKDCCPNLYAVTIERFNNPEYIGMFSKGISDERVKSIFVNFFANVDWGIVLRVLTGFKIDSFYIDSKLFNPLVSVIVPVYNVEDYLDKCIDSIVKQTYFNIEVICIDNNSSDESLSIIKKWVCLDKRVRYSNQPIQGLGPTRNKGIDMASGYYIYFLDSDDYILPETIENLVCQMKSEIDFVMHGVENIALTEQAKQFAIGCQNWLDGYEKETGEYILGNDFKRELPSLACNKLYFAGLLKKYNIRFVNVINEDEVFLWSYMIHCKRYFYLKDKFYKYCRREGSIMGSRDNSIKVLDIISVHEEILNELKRRKLVSKYRRILVKNFINDMKALLKRVPDEYLSLAKKRIRSYVFRNITLSPRLLYLYFYLLRF